MRFESLNPYLTFPGTCETAMRFYEKVLGGKIDAMLKFAGTPAEQHSPPDMRDKILHARLTVGNQILMASDAPSGRYEPMKGSSVTLVMNELADAERVFAALSEGGNVSMPIQETFWAARFGMVVDKFGTSWMINCNRPR